jgi:hypothetical protein
MVKVTGILLSLLLTVASGAMTQSVADAARANKNTGTSSQVFGEDDLDSLRTKTHASDVTSGSSSAFCDSACQNEVIDTLAQKISRKDAESLLALGITLARDDGEWQELIGRVQTSICNEKKTGTQASGDAALQREIVLRISREQKEMAELQDKALRSGSPADLDELKQRSAKLVVIGVGVKRMASGASCTN